MPPKKKPRTQSADRTSSEKKGNTKTKKESAAALKAAKESEKMAKILEEISADPLISKDKISVSQFLDSFKNKEYNVALQREGKPAVVLCRGKFDWSKLKRTIDARTAHSPRWFIQVRQDDLTISAPQDFEKFALQGIRKDQIDGCVGIHVDSVNIVEAGCATLSPSLYLTRPHLSDGDPEDHIPDQFVPLAEAGFAWHELVKDDGSQVNCFVLRKKSSTATSSTSFGFGSTVPSAATGAPVLPSFSTSLGSVVSSAAPDVSTTHPPTAAPALANFGFGGALVPSQTPPLSGVPSAPNFGFGTNSASSAAVKAPSFGFGVQSSATSVSTGGTVAGFGSTKPVNETPDEPTFVVLSLDNIKNLKKVIKEGKKIKIRKFPLPDVGSVTLTMDDTTPIDEAVTTNLKSIWAGRSEAMKEFTNWVDECPVTDAVLGEKLSEYREKYLCKLMKEDPSYEELRDKCEHSIRDRLLQAQKKRQEQREQQLRLVDEAHDAIKRGTLVPKDQCRLLKYYPENGDVPFRPHGKISGLTDVGESLDLCYPPNYVPPNPFAQK